MPLPNQHALKTRIIDRFRRQPLLTARALHEFLSKGEQSCTLQAVYKELRGLIAEGIVQKIGSSYTLNSVWVLQLQVFAGQLAASSFSETAGIPLLARQKKRQRWTFQSLLEMNDLWGHVFVYLARHAERKAILGWNPYLWFHLFQYEQEDRFLKSLRLAGCRFHVMVGPPTFLNLWAKKLFDKNDVTYSFAPGPFRQDTDTYINVIDDHILTAKLAAPTARRLERLFHDTTGFEQFAQSDAARIFMQDGRCTLTLDHNPRRAATLRRQFGQYFGASFE